MVWSKDEMCKLAAAEIRDGWYANLGIGLPTGVANHMPQNKKIILHSENGMLGGGPFPTADQVDPDLINAGKQTVSELPYTCYFDSALSFVMLRGGHIDIAILGALQVSEKGDLANWIIPGKMINGVGGAMDIVSGVKRIVVLMEHVSKDGKPKILKE